jgi:hypothetical protein
MKFYRLGLVVVFICYSFMACRFFSIGHVMPVDDDETQHFDNARNFGLYSSLKASDILSEDVSKVGACDWYGPAYPLFFGTFNKIFCNFYKGYIVTNIVLLFLVVVLLFRIKEIEMIDKLWLAIAVLIAPPVSRYLFFFMPCILDLFFAAVLVFMLFKISGKDQEKRGSSIFMYWMLVVLFSFFKENFVFAVAGILPFAKNRKQFWFFLLACAVGLIAVLEYSAFFLAPAYVKPLAAAQNIFKLGFSNFSETMHQASVILRFMANNVKKILLPDMSMHMYLPLYYLLFILPLLNLYMGFRLKNKLLISLGLIVSLTNVACVLFYNTACYAMVRLSIPYVLMNLAGVVLFVKHKKYLQLGWIALFGLLFPLNFMAVLKHHDYMIDSYCKIIPEQGMFSQLKGLVGCSETKVTTILYDQNFLHTYGPTFILALPLVDNCKGRIRYTANIEDEEKFKIWGKLKVDYILSLEKLQQEQFKLISSNKYYFLYKI